MEILRNLVKHPFYYHKVEPNACVGGAYDVTCEPLKPCREFHLTHITANTDGKAGLSAALGYLEGTTFAILHWRSPVLIGSTVDWDGDVFLKEGDRINVRFWNVGQGETVEIWAMGYEILLPNLTL